MSKKTNTLQERIEILTWRFLRDRVLTEIKRARTHAQLDRIEQELNINTRTFRADGIYSAPVSGWYK